MANINKEEAWNFALALAQLNGAEPSKEFLELIEKEIRGEITLEEIERIIYEKDNISHDKD